MRGQWLLCTIAAASTRCIILRTSDGFRRVGLSRLALGCLLEMSLGRWRIRWTQHFDFVPCQWLTRLCCESGLLFFKSHRRRRRRRLRYNNAAGNGDRRLGRAFASCRRSKNTIPSWSHLRSSMDRGRCNFLLVDDNEGFAHRLCIHKSSLGDGGYSAPHIPVRVLDIRVAGVVVNVVDGDVVYRGVADINPIHIRTACRITRHIDFSWTQWEPTDIAATSATNRN